MRFRRHFRTSSATIDYIIADFTHNRITNRETYLTTCMLGRLKTLNDEYNAKIDKFLNYIIINFDYNDLPVACITRMLFSLSKITNALSKGILTLIKE